MAIPKDTSPESTPVLFSDGYKFIQNKCEELGSDVFETRILLKRTICMRGEEAAKVFYDTTHFKREKAAPKRLQKTLFGKGGVQGLDGKAHQRRKEMFMSLMSPARIERLMTLMKAQWDNYIGKWQDMQRVELFSEVEELICRAVCAWANVPLEEGKVRKRTRQMTSLIESAGEIALGHYEGRRDRKKVEKWIGKLVGKTRDAHLEPQKDSALYIISWHRDAEGKLLDEHVASVEILNVLRPTIAVARFVVFLADALHHNPKYQEKLKQNNEMHEWFVQEVRRYYPFFPFAAARVKDDFQWNGYHFPKGRRVLLDLYGTNHKSEFWDDPDTFRPERFAEWNGGAHNFIPQGGGDHYYNHRCAGEWITIASMKLALHCLTEKMTYRVPEQDLTIDLGEFPAAPESRFVIDSVRKR